MAVSSALLLPPKDPSIRGAKYRPQDGTRTEYRIAGVDGLTLAVMPPINKVSRRVWRVLYTVSTGGKRFRRKMVIGTYPATPLRDAIAEAAIILREVERGRDPFAERAAAEVAKTREALTFEQDLVDYLDERRPHVVRVDKIEDELKRDAVPEFGAKRPADVTAADVDRAAQRCLTRNAPAMARRLIEHVKAMYNYALLDKPQLAEKYGIVANPAATLGRRRRGSKSLYQAPRPRDRALHDEEISLFLKAMCASEIRPATMIALRLILLTGQRPGEVRQIQSAHLRLNGEAPAWTIPAELAKNRREHVVPLAPEAVALLLKAAELSRSGTFLFPHPRDTMRPIDDVALPSAIGTLRRNGYLKYRRHSVAEELTVAPFTAHDLRRTAGTGMRRLRVPREIVGLILNHTPQDVTGSVYDRHEALDERREALVKWARHVGQLELSTVQ